MVNLIVQYSCKGKININCNQQSRLISVTDKKLFLSELGYNLLNMNRSIDDDVCGKIPSFTFEIV